MITLDMSQPVSESMASLYEYMINKLDEEVIFGEKLLPLEKALAEKLDHYMKAIRFDISDQQKKKVSLHAYMDPYNQVFRDGAFYDKKK